MRKGEAENSDSGAQIGEWGKHITLAGRGWDGAVHILGRLKSKKSIVKMGLGTMGRLPAGDMSLCFSISNPFKVI